MPRICALIAASFFIAACGPSQPGGDDAGDDASTIDAMPQPHTLTGIRITPTNPIVELDLNTTGAQDFTATGVYADGVDEDLTPMVTWAVMNPAVGAMTGAHLDIPAFATATAVVSRITATYNSVDGEAQITVVAYRTTGPQQDFFFILPYVDPAGQQTKPLDFSTVIPKLDVFFDQDTTGSMGGEITNLRTALNGTVIPGINAAVADSEFGVGAFEDFPISPYGSTGNDGTYDQPFKLRQAMTTDTTAVATAVSNLSYPANSSTPIGYGFDGPESGLESLYQIATGEGLSSPSPTSVPANHTGVGGVGFRADAMPVIVDITDAETHGIGEPDACSSNTEAYDPASVPTAHTRVQTKTALNAICARVVGISSSDGATDVNCTSQPYLEDLAASTGALVPPSAWDVGTRPAGCAASQCCTGLNGVGRATNAQGLCPVVYLMDVNGSGLGTSLVTGIQMLTRFATFDVTHEEVGLTVDEDGNPLPVPHTTAEFIKSVVPTGFTLPPPPPTLPNPTFDSAAFHGVTPGTTVDFDVNAFNDFIQQTAQAQIFRATIRVLAGGCTPLDERQVLILVPPIPVTVE